MRHLRLLFLVVIILTGCAGSVKYKSDPIGSCITWNRMPPERSVSIVMFRPIEAPDTYSAFCQKAFPKILGNKLKEHNLFTDIYLESPNNQTAKVSIEIAIANIASGLQLRQVGYVQVGTKGIFSVAFRVVDVSSNTIIMTGTSTRVSHRETLFLTSGIFWDGITITGEEQFIVNLMNWVADDIVERLKESR